VSLWAERQYLAGRGYAVLEVWPRGSEGFGDAYRRANVQDWGPGPASDVLTLTDSVATRSGVDASRAFLAGRSYGASLAVWLLGHTDRFRAAVAQGGAYDLAAFYGESVAEATLADQFGGPPWATTPVGSLPSPQPAPLVSAGLPPPSDSARPPRAALRRSAPLTSAHRIETPLLLLHGTRDHTASSTQSLRLYRRLKTLERPVEYVRYPGVRHQFDGASPTQRVDRLVRLHEFFRRYASPAERP
jgi:dipeptidyl aminopeptidase/acylaminoacyl peptidase